MGPAFGRDPLPVGDPSQGFQESRRLKPPGPIGVDEGQAHRSIGCDHEGAGHWQLPGVVAVVDGQVGAHCAERLAPFKRPHEIEFRESLPKTLIGKTLRKELAREETAKRKTAVPA